MASMASTTDVQVPFFSAVSSSARQLFLLLRCLSFASKAQLQITDSGLRFTAEEYRVMQGMVFLDKSLFANYIFSPNAETRDEDADTPSFQISLSALLETLQIFGVNDAKDRWSSRDPSYGGLSGSMTRGGSAAAFDNRVLGMAGVCRLSYAGVGEPMCIVLEETGVTTTCELVTYEPDMQASIPLQKDALTHRIIMRASWLYDAINELSSTSPTRLTIVVSPTAPHFTLSSAGPLGSATIEFTKDPQLLETFEVARRISNTYKYSLIKTASRAMAMASKVSIRTDEQGVLNMQFMIDVEGGGTNFIDFKFVAYISEEGDEDEEEEDVADVADVADDALEGDG